MGEKASEPPIAFINLPYAKRYEKVYLSFIAGVAGYGLVPTAAVRDPSSHYQLERIYQLISAAQYSDDLFETRPFSELAYVASASAHLHIASLAG